MISTKYSVHKTIIARYEPNIGSGTGFIYNVEIGKMKTTDFLGFKIVRLLRNQQSIPNIKDLLLNQSIPVSEDIIYSYIQHLIVEGFAFQIESHEN